MQGLALVVSSRLMLFRRLLFCVLLASGCTQSETPRPSTSANAAKSVESIPSAAASVAPTNSAMAASGEPPLEALPPLAPSSVGPAYVLVNHSGVLQIDDDGVRVAIPIPEEKLSIFTQISISASGRLWLTDFQGIRVRSLKGDISTPRVVKDGPLYENLILLSDSDVWGVTSDIEWNIVHYNGSSWKNVRQRSQFPGKYEDNKFSGLAVTSEGVWVASWNGLWRGNGDRWEQIDLPDGVGTGPQLFTYRDQVLVAGAGVAFLRKAGTWSKLALPENILLRYAIHDLGLFAAPHRNKGTVFIGSVEGSTKYLESEAVLGKNILTLAFDTSGRLWVGTEQALSVLDRRGHIIKEWSTGTLLGLNGSIMDLAIVAGGPTKLPEPRAAKLWEIKGQFVAYRSSKAIGGATITLCPPGTRECATSPGAKRVTTDDQGGFRFSDVPEGEFWLDVQPPPQNADCKTPFTVTDTSLVPRRDCRENPAAPGVCDLGTIRTCLPFEMPPRH